MQNTNTPTRGIPVDIGDGRERRLRYTFATRKQMIEEFGGEEAMTTGLTGDKLTRVLWFGLKHEDAEITVEHIENSLDMENLVPVAQAMIKAMGYKGKVLLGTEGTEGAEGKA